MWLNGKIHDLTVVGLTSLLSGRLIQDIPLAMQFLLHGRVKLPPIPFTGSSGFRKIRSRALELEKEVTA
jgi:hypothetical protein